MDALDVAILRTMGIDPYVRGPRGPDALKPGTIAKAIGVTPETVRERLRRLEAAGTIAGYQVHVNLRHLGMETSSFLFRVGDEDRRAKVAEQLAPVDGLLAVHAFLGPDLCVDVAFRSEADLARRLQLLGSLTGDPQPAGFYNADMPPVREPLTNLDWRIIQALRGRARRPLEDVAADVGVSYRTVKRRFDRLCNEGSIFVVPQFDPGKEPGTFLCWITFALAPGAEAKHVAAVRRAFAERHLMGIVPTHARMGNLALLLVADSPAQAEALRREGAAMPGVARTSTLVPTGDVDCSGWVDVVIAERIAATAPGRVQRQA